MKPIDFDPAAAADAQAAAEWYEAVRLQLGVDFRDELASALARIRTNPQMYAAESGAIRLAPLNRFPYSIVYEELADRIWVAAVAHHHRRPGYWSGRAPI